MEPVTVFDVLLNKEIEIIGIDGKNFKVNIPSNFDSSRKLRLAGQGMPDPYNGVRGDLLIELFVNYPELSEEQRKMVEQIANM
jgi:curved DNA-binding protein